MTTSHVRPPSEVSAEPERREGLAWRLDRATSGGLGHPLRPAVAPVGSAPRRHSGRGGHAWADQRASEDERMRVVAALLVLGSLLVWILFLQG